LATGQFTVHNTANGAAEHHSVSPNLWLIAALVVIALGLLASFIVKGSNAVNLMLASSLGALALSFGGMLVAHNRDQHQVSANNSQQLDQATEPRQAFRALRTQAESLQNAAVAITDFDLAGAAKALKEHLDASAEIGRSCTQELAEDVSGVFRTSEKAAKPKKQSILWVE
jgi:hypothetical protein